MVLAFELSFRPIFLAPLWVGTHFPMQMGQPGANPILVDPYHGGTRGHKNLENPAAFQVCR